MRTGLRTVLRRALLVLGHLWTLPNTLLGLFVGLVLTRGRPRYEARHGFLAFASGRGISSTVKRAGPWATTFGGVVVFWEPAVARDEGFLVHEAVHVRQYLWLGPLFLPLYLLFVPLKGWRRRHPLERPAYREGDAARRADRGSQPCGPGKDSQQRLPHGLADDP